MRKAATNDFFFFVCLNDELEFIEGSLSLPTILEFDLDTRLPVTPASPLVMIHNEFDRLAS